MARSAAPSLACLGARIEACRACPRLVRFRERLAREGEAKTGQPFWGRPIRGFGDPLARLVLVGLAPAAQGANRTGRVFTGDRSASFLMSALHRAGFANQARSDGRDDGLRLRDAFITAAVRCVPPDNRPTTMEAERCRPYLAEELRLLPRTRVVVALGGFAWEAVRRTSPTVFHVPPPKGGFAHGRRLPIGPGAPVLWGLYHPSPRNVNTGLLTTTMFDQVLDALRRDLGDPP